MRQWEAERTRPLTFLLREQQRPHCRRFARAGLSQWRGLRSNDQQRLRVWKVSRGFHSTCPDGTSLPPVLLIKLNQPHPRARYTDEKTKGYNKSIAPEQPVKASPKPPARAPDVVFSEKTTEEQAVLYRLSGDFNPLHIEPSIGKGMGFPGAILHGLASYGSSFVLCLRAPPLRRLTRAFVNRSRRARDRAQGCRRRWCSLGIHEFAIHEVRRLPSPPFTRLI
jgi:hypothetical protein